MEKRNACDIRREYTSLINKISINSAKYEVAKVKYNDLVSKRDRMLSRKKALENEIKLLNEKNNTSESEFINNKQNKLFNRIMGLGFGSTVLIDTLLLISGNAQNIGNTGLNVALFAGIPQIAASAGVYGLMSKSLTSKYRNQFRNSEEFSSSNDRISECEKVIDDFSDFLEDLNKMVDLAQREVISLDNKVRYLNIELRRIEEEINSTNVNEIESRVVRVLNK